MEWRLPEDTLKQLEKVQDSACHTIATVEIHSSRTVTCYPTQDREPVDDPTLVGDAQAGLGEDAKVSAGGSQIKL